MIDNLEDAITHAREVAEEQREEVKYWDKVKGVGVFTDANAKHLLKTCEERAKEHEQLAEWLEELKTKREADRWIPVSERLPEDRKKVRVTAYWHERFQVMDASYYGDGIWWCVPFNNCGEHMRNDLHVIAWKPDDEPYKESEETNE